MSADKRKERFIYKDDETMEKGFDWKQFRLLLPYLKPYAKQLLPIAIIMTVIGAITKIANPYIISLIIDKGLVDKNAKLLVECVSVLFLLFIVQSLTGFFRMRMTTKIGQSIIHDLRNDLFRHIQHLSFRFFDKRPAGAILVRVTNDVNALQELFTNGVVNLMIDCVQLVGIVAVLCVLNIKLALAVIIIVPVMFYLSQTLRDRIRIVWQHVRTRQSRINAHLNESIQGIRVTQAFGQEGNNTEFFNEINEGNRKLWDRAQTMNATFGPLVMFTGAVGTFILFWYGSHLVQMGEISIGLVVAFSYYMSFFWEPISRLGDMYSQVLVAVASSERIFEFMNERPSVAESRDAYELPPVDGAIRLLDVEFEYEPGRPALRGVDLDVKPGQSVALVGHTGSGKSTIINLLCRFYDPDQGRITIDGHDVRDVTLQSLRSQIGIVLQDTFIFSGSIRDNIRYGRLDATDAEVEAAAKAVNAHEFIMRLPNGYNTEVEERGSALSMGQRQLLSFARALLADPRILILDEATASIDTETEQMIQHALNVLLQGRTSFMIAHRLSTIRHADMIVVLDHGVIKEIGTHRELLDKRGIYNGLIEAQYRYFAS